MLCGMRKRRSILVMKDRVQYFHVMSRVVDRRMVMGEEEKGMFCRMMRQFEGFSGVRVRAYCVMGNHFHLLLEVPMKPDAIVEEEVWERMSKIYGPERMKEFHENVEIFRRNGEMERIEEFMNGMRVRMFDLSQYVKDLKQKFTKWYNLQNERKGTLWEERFKSVLVGNREGSLRAVSSYIDMNPVRAGIVDRPELYRWSSLGEAMSGGELAQRGYDLVLGCLADYNLWKKSIGRHYAMGLLGDKGGQEGPCMQFEHGELKRRIRQFSDGWVIGDKEFISEFLALKRDEFDFKRPKSGFPFSGGGWGDMRSFRRLVK